MGSRAEDIDLDWYALPLKRSKWFDLFDPADRVLAMRTVWGLLGWMMRDMNGDGDAEAASKQVGKEREKKGETVGS